MVEKELAKQAEKAQKMDIVFTMLKQAFPKLQEDLEQLTQSTKPILAVHAK